MMKRKYIMVFILMILLAVILLLLFIAQHEKIEEFIQDPFRTYKISQYGRVEHGAIMVTSDGKYRIENNLQNQLCFNMYYEVGLEYEVIRSVIDHKRKGENYYIKSDEGYAVVNIDTKICKVHITVPEEEFVKYSGSVDENGNKIYKSRFINDEHIKYLQSYEDFSNIERDVFNKMR